MKYVFQILQSNLTIFWAYNVLPIFDFVLWLVIFFSDLFKNSMEEF